MIVMPVNMAGNRYRPPARYHRQNMTRHCMAVRGSDFWQGAKSRQQLAHDYMRHIVSHFAAERMKHVKQYLEGALSNYRAGGPVRREYPHDAGMAGKTKATTKGSPVEIKEIKRTANNAMNVAGGQYAVYDEWPLGPDVRIFLRHVLFRKLSSAKASGASLCSRARALSSLRVNSVALACSRAAFRFRSCSVIRALVSVTIMAKEFFFWSSISYPLLLDRLECCFKKSSSAKLVLKAFSNRLCISISAMCLVIACFFSTKCCSYAVRSSFLFSDCEVCCVLSILCTCKTMRRTSSHHGADGFCLFHRVAEETASYQPGGRFLVAFNRRGYFSTKSSRAKRFCERFFTSGSGFNSSDSGSSWARLSSRWCSSMPYKSCLRCSAKISVMDLYFLFMLLPCKAMRRSSSHHGADSDYSDSLALRRWRRLISPCIDVMINCDVLSPDSFTDSIASTISCGTRAFKACDFAFVVPVAISVSPVDWWGTVYTEKTQIKPLTWTTPKTYSGPHLDLFKVHKCKAPQVSLPLAGLLTTNDNESIEVAMRNHITHPQGRDSHNLNKFTWRFMQCLTGSIAIFTVTAATEREARARLPHAHLIFVARIRQGVSHA